MAASASASAFRLLAVVGAALVLGAVTAVDAAVVKLTSGTVSSLCESRTGPLKSLLCSFNATEKTTVRMETDCVPDGISLLTLTGMAQLVVERGAIRTSVNLTVEANLVSESVVFENKAVTLLGKSASVLLRVSSSGGLNIANRAVSSQGGSFDFHVDSVAQVRVEKQAFDVLQSVRISNVTTLKLDPTAFKPSVRLGSGQEVLLENVATLPVLAEESFASAKSILIRRCRVKEVASAAFSSIQMESIVIENSSIDRVQQGAFSEKTLINRLAFVNSTVTIISEHAIQSAISSLEISGSEMASISKEAFHCPVASIRLENNRFQTLGNRSLSFTSWSEFAMIGNFFRFLDEDALAGVTNPESSADASFAFVNNVVSYANRGSLRLDDFDVAVAFNVSGNAFERECSCEFDPWLAAVCVGTGDFSKRLRESSLCRVASEEQHCFSPDPFQPVSAYADRLCGDDERTGGQTGSMCVQQRVFHVWQVFVDQIQINTTKGILLVILLFAFAASLVLSIYTLIRWIVYTLQLRYRKRAGEEEWNFTKVEVRQDTESPDSRDHYESLPLTKEEEDENSIKSVGQVSSQPAPTASEQPTAQPTEEKPNPKRSSFPQMTFYDEMIDLLKEKLDDPENYSTVADSRNAGLYNDPLDDARDKSHYN